jgi:hypothetical protein
LGSFKLQITPCLSLEAICELDKQAPKIGFYFDLKIKK